MNRSTAKREQRPRVRGNSAPGFSLLELMFVVLILGVMSAMAVPLINNVMTGYRLRGATSSLAGSIQSTRYQAIFNGVPFRLVLNSAALTYQVQSDPTRTGAFANFCVPAAASCPVPLAGSAIKLALNADTTFTFSPGGTVVSTTAVAGVTTMVLTYAGKTENITVSSYGRSRSL